MLTVEGGWYIQFDFCHRTDFTTLAARVCHNVGFARPPRLAVLLRRFPKAHHPHILFKTVPLIVLWIELQRRLWMARVREAELL